jgi:hypothetical protein
MFEIYCVLNILLKQYIILCSVVSYLNRDIVTRRQGRRHKKLLDDLKDRGGYSHLKEEARSHFLEEALNLSSDRILKEEEYCKNA